MDVLAALFTDPLSYGFMQRGLVIALMVGTVCAVLSCYLILKGWSLMGDAISHAVLPGIVLAFITGIPLLLGALAARAGGAAVMTAAARVTLWGALAMALTAGVGALLGVAA